MKKVLSALLIAIMILPLVSYYYSHEVLLKSLKRQVKSTLLGQWKKEGDIILYFSHQEIAEGHVIIYDEDLEIEVDGKMYDILSQSKSENGISFRCLPDKEETQFKSKLKSQLFRLFAQNPIQKTQTKAILHFLENLFFEPIEFCFVVKPTTLTSHTLFAYLRYRSGSFIAQLSPPPEWNS